MAKRIVTVCDTCGSEKDVRKFTLSGGGQTVRPELCEEHAAPLAALLPAPKATAAKKATAKAA
ncbi:MAG TPA: hypothetical protein VN520_21235 [Streptomyces sp.]|uniref:hypothetical protein n=1 Tax=Streptomyces sp. TaxID=1931 RepID=UPI002BE9F348|nr:hypothetical protein [Streptomyces sp.]HWU08873.1 hypothetical protein [Streptomyces sp.]